jgi:hypothetical protein
MKGRAGVSQSIKQSHKGKGGHHSGKKIHMGVGRHTLIIYIWKPLFSNFNLEASREGTTLIDVILSFHINYFLDCFLYAAERQILLDLVKHTKLCNTKNKCKSPTIITWYQTQ